MLNSGKKIEFSKAELGSVFFVSSVLLLTVIGSGTITEYGLSFWGPNGHDAVFHLAMIQSLADNFTLANPMIAGENIVNYHLGFDLMVAVLSRLLPINLLDLFFRWVPITVVLAVCFGALNLMNSMGFKKWEKVCGLFAFGLLGSLGFLKTTLSGDLFGGESIFWANQSASILLNPPFALSLAILFFWLWLLSKKNKGRMANWLVYLIPALAFHVKAYSGLLMIGGLTMSFFSESFLSKKVNFRELLYLTAGILLFVFSVYLVLGKQSLIEFEPLWFVRQMISSTDRLYSQRLSFAYDNWLQAGSLVKLSVVQIFLIGVFLLGNMGIRVLGIFEMARADFTKAMQVVTWIVVLGIAVPLVFVQKGTPWNTIQFMYYSLALTGLFTGRFIAKRLFSSPNLVVFSFWCTVFGLGMMTSFGTIRDYLSPIPASYISTNEITAGKSMDGGTVLTRPFDLKNKRSFYSPLPLYVYESTGYVAMISDSDCYACDEVNLSIMNYDFKNRLNTSREIFGSSDPIKIASILEREDIQYIYVDPLTNLSFEPDKLSYRMIASRGGFRVWQKIK